MRLAEWINEQSEPPAIEELLEAFQMIRRCTLTEIEPFLERVGCVPGEKSELGTMYRQADEH
jgi:hypothetical protein